MFSYTHFAARYLLPHSRKTTLLALCLFPFGAPFLMIILNVLGLPFLLAWS